MPAGGLSTAPAHGPRITGGARLTGNLTRAEAEERARLLRVRSYRIELDLHGSAAPFRSLTTIVFDCAQPGAGSFIDLTAAGVRSIELNGGLLPLTLFDGSRVRLPSL